MKKGLTRWLMSIGLAGTTLLGTMIPALALTQAEIEERLDAIPVFTVTDANGAPLVARVEDQLFAGIFINPSDADAFRQRVMTQNAELNNSVQVIPVSMREIYRIERERAAQAQSSPSEENIDFVYIPEQQQLDLAQSLLPAGQEIQGVPLFAVRVSDPSQPGSNNSVYLTLQQEDGSPVVPFYFSKQQADALAQRYRESTSLPANSNAVTIEVSTLEVILANWEQSDQPGLQQIFLVPSPAAIQRATSGN